MKKITVFGLVAFIAFACSKKEEEQKLEAETIHSEETAFMLQIDEELDQFTEMSMEGSPESKKSSTCFSYTVDTSSSPRTITLDWGPVNCLGRDGVNRRGKITISFQHRSFRAGAVRSITLDGYAVNDVQIDGNRSVTFRGMNSNGQPYTDIDSRLKISYPDSSSALWSSQRTRTWLRGFGNRDPFDNVFQVSGSASGTTQRGINYQLAITKPLRAEASCANLVSGTIDISSPSFRTRTLDYGNGACDRIATIAVGNRSKRITLRR